MGTEKATVVMDARKFARHINNGAAAKLKFFEDAVARMGAQVEQNLRLTSLDSTSLIFEDVDKNLYYMADIKKATRGKVDLDNIRPIQIVESEKPNQFQKNCLDLVNAICEDDLKQADRVFGRIESQRYNSHVIPESGYITLKDDVTRKVTVSNRIVSENRVEKITKLVAEAVEDQVTLQHGRIVKGSLSDGSTQLTIPINEYTRRRLVAHKMRSLAESAYKSSSFQDFVLSVGSALCEGDMKKACQISAKFLSEEQEFCLLTSKQFTTLVENALATRNEFNSFLARDIAKVLHETNLAVNKEDIIESWTRTAQKAENAQLLRNVSYLAEHKDFNQTHDRFLNLVFNESMDVQTARAKAYRTTLKIIVGIIPELEDEEDSASSVEELEELIERLSGSEPDTDAILQAEELLASISDSLIDNIQALESFDQEPSEDEVDQDEDEDAGELVPLPEVGEGDEAEDEGEGEEGGEAGFGAPEAPGGEDEGFPLAADAEHPGRSQRVGQMDLDGLLESAEDWRLNAEQYLMEHGYDACSQKLNNFIQRCIALGPKTSVIRESFENMRDQLVTSNGEKILEDLELNEDPYSDSLAVALNGPTRLLSDNDPENDPDFVGRNVAESKINRDYIHLSEDAYPNARVPHGVSAAEDDLRMDDHQGSGGVAHKSPKKSDGRRAGGEAAGYEQDQRGNAVQGKGLKPVDGRSGHHSTSGAPGGDLRMDDHQGTGGVLSKGLHSSDGRKGGMGASTAAESTVAAHGGNPSTDLSMGSDFQGKSGKGSVTGKGLTHADGASGTGAKDAGRFQAAGGPSAVSLRMDDHQGSDGVEDKQTSHDHPGDVKSTKTKKASRGGDMSDHQGKDTVTRHNKGMAEGTFTPEHIASLIAEMEKSGCCDGGCEEAGKCDDKCPCPDGCKCKTKPMSESKDGADWSVDEDGDDVPDALEKIRGEKDSKDGKEDSSKDSKDGVESESLVEMEDELADLEDMAEEDDDIAVVIGPPDKVLDELQDVLADLTGGGDEDMGDMEDDDMDEADISGDDLEDMDLEDDLGGVEDDSEEIEDALSDEDDDEEDDEVASEA